MDIDFLLWLQGLRNPVLDALNYGLTLFAEEAVLLGVLCMLYWCTSKKKSMFIIFSFVFGMVVNTFLKVSFCVERPWIRDARVQPHEKALGSATGYSFPSGHTACATAVYGGFAILTWARRRWLSLLLWALTVLIGFSRIYLGVHTPQDVVVSLVVGAALLWAVNVGRRGLKRHPERDIWVLAGGLAAALGLLLYTLWKPYPADVLPSLLEDGCKTAGAMAGVAMGWFLERRTLNFSTKAPWYFQIGKMALGVGGILAIRSLGKPVCNALAGANLGGAIRYFFMVFWAMWIWPLIFSKVQSRLNLQGKK